MRTCILLLLVLMVSPLFAAAQDIRTQCQQSCCAQYDGTWSGGYCSGTSSSTAYSTCVQTCEQVASGNFNCCGSAFVLAALGSAAFVRSRR